MSVSLVKLRTEFLSINFHFTLIQKEEIIIKALGEKISFFRKENNLSLEDLARKLDVNHQELILWENGDSRPTIKEIEKLCEIYDIKLNLMIPNRKLENEKMSSILKQVEGARGILYLKNIKSQPFAPDHVIKNVRIVEVKANSMKIHIDSEVPTRHIISTKDVLGFLEEVY